MKVTFCDICQLPIKERENMQDEELNSFFEAEKEWAEQSVFMTPFVDNILDKARKEADICIECKKQLLKLFSEWLKNRKAEVSHLLFDTDK